jgi:hypothetical protein
MRIARPGRHCSGDGISSFLRNDHIAKSPGETHIGKGHGQHVERRSTVATPRVRRGGFAESASKCNKRPGGVYSGTYRTGYMAYLEFGRADMTG